MSRPRTAALAAYLALLILVLGGELCRHPAHSVERREGKEWTSRWPPHR